MAAQAEVACMMGCASEVCEGAQILWVVNGHQLKLLRTRNDVIILAPSHATVQGEMVQLTTAGHVVKMQTDDDKNELRPAWPVYTEHDYTVAQVVGLPYSPTI